MIALLNNFEDTKLAKEYFEIIIEHYSAMDIEKFKKCISYRTQIRATVLDAASFMNSMSDVYPNLYNKFKSLFPIDTEYKLKYYPRLRSEITFFNV